MKDAVRKTVVVYWSDEDECFVAESPLFDPVAGTGDTEEEALEMFEGMLDDASQDLERDNVAGYKDGRPTNRVKLELHVKPDTFKLIAELADRLGISHGEAVDYLAFYFSKKH